MKGGLLAMMLTLTSCSWSGSCPCGADTSESLQDHNLSDNVEHVVSRDCECYCGDDEPFLMPQDRVCAEYAGGCRDKRGTTHTLRCE